MSTQKYSTVNIPNALTVAVDTRCRDGEKRGPRLTSDLEDYYALLDSGLRQARAVLTPAEAKLILDTQSSAFPGPLDIMAGLLKTQVTDSITLDGLAGKWDVDDSTLLGKIEAMGDLARVALLDWTRQVWGKDEFDVDQETAIFRGA